MTEPITPKIERRTFLTGAGAIAAGVAAGVTAPSATATPSPRGRYRIDLHAHFLPPEYRKALLEHGHFTIGGYPTPDWSPESAIDFMDRWGIQAQALSVSDPGVGFLKGQDARDLARYCNTFAARLFRKHGKRFGAFATLPMPDVASTIREIEYALDVLKLDGVTLLSAYNGVYLGDPRFEPVMEALNRRRAFVFVHPAAIPANAKPELPLPDFLEEFTFDTTRAATLMMAGGTLQRYPGIRFQLSHAGGTVPFLAWRLGVLSATPVGDLWPAGAPRPAPLDVQRWIRSFYYDTALSASEPAMRAVLSVTDRSHIVFGSDWPFSQMVYTGSGDPAPGLGTVFNARQRYEIEHINPLRQLPRLKSAI
ncbi:amidohydrolase family protein [Gordonia sp. UBA7599]|uniref:amidohydrolase family protein n=1 Tax=unclassified Gordonia (in: high G+C Gram-positive bacteria) TaxID=2657482 RepID=UPI000F923B16|nr:amidohydrolase family protein [Gordonia sp. UBA7599]RUP38613.1 MAG: amidohydrolase [Gordonia sp. (in: high G+C Gram-positive bacteria)]HNP56219.1 amidohydrolase family protein [Gordonia sp. (in: high G+C Gram-positive bacteria)]